MKNYLIVLLSLFSFQAFTQTTHQLTANSGVTTKSAVFPVQQQDGSFDLIGNTHFGFDSSFVSLYHTDTDWNFTSEVHYKLPFSTCYIRVMLPVENGYLMGGFISGFGNIVWLMRLDANFDVLWQRMWDDITLGSYQVKAGFLNGDSATFYLGEASQSDALYRIQTDIDGSYFDIDQLVNDPLDERGLYGFTQVDQTGQVLCGTIIPNGTNNHNGFLSYHDSQGEVWTKMFDFGQDVDERFANVISLSSGHLLAILQQYDPDVSEFKSYICKLNINGEMLWCKRIAMASGGVQINHAVELSSGELLFTGIVGNFQRSLIKTDAEGNLLWTRTWDSPGEFFAETEGFFPLADNRQMLSLTTNEAFLIELDENGDGCGFTEFEMAGSFDFNDYTVSNLAYNVVAASGTGEEGYYLERTIESDVEVLCVDSASTGLNFTSKENYIVYPNPAQTELYFSREHAPDSQILIYRSDGKQEWSGSYQLPLVVTGLSKGMKFIQVLEGDRVFQYRFIKE